MDIDDVVLIYVLKFFYSRFLNYLEVRNELIFFFFEEFE